MYIENSTGRLRDLFSHSLQGGSLDRALSIGFLDRAVEPQKREGIGAGREDESLLRSCQWYMYSPSSGRRGIPLAERRHTVNHLWLTTMTLPQNFHKLQLSVITCLPWVPEVSRGPLPETLTETGNRARQTSGTQGIMRPALKKKTGLRGRKSRSIFRSSSTSKMSSKSFKKENTKRKQCSFSFQMAHLGVERKAKPAYVLKSLVLTSHNAWVPFTREQRAVRKSIL